jgi:hypothetical protein
MYTNRLVITAAHNVVLDQGNSMIPEQSEFRLNLHGDTEDCKKIKIADFRYSERYLGLKK